MNKDFDTWNKQKKVHHQGKQKAYCKEREIWWIYAGLNIGDEEDGKGERFERPILVIKKFNQHLFWGCSLSTKIKPSNKFYYPIQTALGLRSVIISQLRVYDTKRLDRKVLVISTTVFNQVKTAIKELL